VKDTQAYLKDGPGFKPIRKTNPNREEIFFKPPSRSSGWKEAVCNGIKTVICSNSGAKTEEWSFVTYDRTPSSAVSADGDSGAPLIDKEYRPAAIIWGGTPPDAFGRWVDVTYATPFFEILKDIECRMGFEEGSVSYR
jgi:hypothetical protein